MTFALPFATWLLLSYFGNIPLDLEEAALVDGATRYQVLTRVVLPLLLPGLVVAFVFSFLLAWSDVLFASVLTVENTRTLAVGLQAYTAAGESGAPVYWGQLMAASLMSEVPIVAIFLVVQRYIVSGLTGGAVKG
jgi:ABC-type glycerol-3-phosphate transport system permease component